MAVAAFASNILFWRQTDHFAAATELKPLPHNWSLTVEEQYYMVLPLMLLAVWRFGRRRLLALLVVALLASLAVAQWGVTHRPAATFYLLLTRSWELLGGALAAFYLGPPLAGQRSLSRIAGRRRDSADRLWRLTVQDISVSCFGSIH